MKFKQLIGRTALALVEQYHFSQPKNYEAGLKFIERYAPSKKYHISRRTGTSGGKRFVWNSVTIDSATNRTEWIASASFKEGKNWPEGSPNVLPEWIHQKLYTVLLWAGDSKFSQDGYNNNFVSERVRIG